MAISYISSATGVSSLTMPTHQSGDVLLMFAYRDGSNTAPTVPAGWTTIGSASGGNTNSSVAAYKIAASSGETSGTWTNATGLVVQVYRGCDPTTPIGANVDGGGTNTTSIVYSALTFQVTTGTSWAAAFAGHRSVDTSLQTAPTGMTNRSTRVDTTCEVAGHDTNAGVTSWSQQTVAAGGTASAYRMRVIELRAYVVNNYSLSLRRRATYRVNAGRFNSDGGNLISSNDVYQNDDNFTYTGSTGRFSVTNTITGTDLGDIMKSENYGPSLAYSFSVPNGKYVVRLHFAELYHTAANLRKFSVFLEGVQVLTDLDIYSVAGGTFKAITYSFETTVSDGILNLSTSSSVDNAKFNAIEVIPLGEYQLSLKDLAFKKGYALPISVSAASVGLASANLKRDYTLVAATKSVAVSSTDVTLNKSTSQQAFDTYALAIGTTNTVLRLTRTLSLSPQSYTFGEGVNTQRVQRILVNATKGINLTSQTVAVKAGYKLTASAASLSAVGEVVSIRKSYAPLAATANALTSSGNTVALRLTRQLAALSNSVAVAANTLSIASQRLLPASTSTISIAGTDTGFVYDQVGQFSLLINNRALSVSGQVALAVQRQLSISEASLVSSGSVTLRKGYQMMGATLSMVMSLFDVATARQYRLAVDKNGVLVATTDTGVRKGYPALTAETLAVGMELYEFRLLPFRKLIADTKSVYYSGKSLTLKRGKTLTCATLTIRINAFKKSLKVYHNNTWVGGSLKVYVAGQWKIGRLKRYNGTTWGT